MSEERNPFGRTCAGLLLLMPLWPLLIAAHLLRRHLTSAVSAGPAAGVERAEDAAGPRTGVAGPGRTTPI